MSGPTRRRRRRIAGAHDGEPCSHRLIHDQPPLFIARRQDHVSAIGRIAEDHLRHCALKDHTTVPAARFQAHCALRRPRDNGHVLVGQFSERTHEQIDVLSLRAARKEGRPLCLGPHLLRNSMQPRLRPPPTCEVIIIYGVRASKAARASLRISPRTWGGAPDCDKRRPRRTDPLSHTS